jgi:hypothetical protein
MIIKIDKLSKSAYAGLTKFITSDSNRVHLKDLSHSSGFFTDHHNKCQRSGPGHSNFWLEFAFLKEAREDEEGTFSVVIEVLEKIYTQNKDIFTPSQSLLATLMSSVGLFPPIKEKVARLK